MSFNEYIFLEGLAFKTLAKQWKPQIVRAAVPRLTLAGNMEAAYGTGTLQRWEGIVVAYSNTVVTGYGHNPLTGEEMFRYGTIEDLRWALLKPGPIQFIDHYEATYSVVAQGPFEETYLKNVWNADSNKVYVHVLLTAKYPLRYTYP